MWHNGGGDLPQLELPNRVSVDRQPWSRKRNRQTISSQVEEPLIYPKYMGTWVDLNRIQQQNQWLQAVQPSPGQGEQANNDEKQQYPQNSFRTGIQLEEKG